MYFLENNVSKCMRINNEDFVHYLKVIYHPLYSMNKFVTNKSKLPQDGVTLYGVIGYHVTLWEGHMIANHPI